MPPEERREAGAGRAGAEGALWARIRAAFPAPPLPAEEGTAAAAAAAGEALAAAGRGGRRAKMLRKQQLNPAAPRTNTTPFREAERFYRRADRAGVLRAAMDPRCSLSRAAHGARRAKLACALDGEIFAGRGAEDGEEGEEEGEEDDEEEDDEEEEEEREKTAGLPSKEEEDDDGGGGGGGNGRAGKKGPARQRTGRRRRRRRTAAYVLPAVPGLVLIPGALSPRAQRDLVRACVREYARDPNLTNLHDHYDMPPEGLWALVERQVALDGGGGGGGGGGTGTDAGDSPASWVKLKYKADGGAPPAPPQPSKRTLSSPTGPDPADHFLAEKPDPPASPTVPQLAPAALFRRLRWVTLGYQYHWSSKTYRFDRRCPFPPLAGALARAVARAAEGVAGNSYPGSAFRPEAGVVNFYQPRDALLAHVDRSEVNVDAPLVSLSLGLSCVFLVGTASREDRPSAILLRSGDILVMSGPSRKCFHGVPRVLEGSLPSYLRPDSADARSEDSGWDLVGAYMEQSRINLNIRQVF
ncbi:MAG: hypothetical protein BJ554DRAFT_315 [Olpidium bornovanus]|uniref:Fe2OG dioxygenase domain-containing protein n=1 Tax=Olpidium bornovanus TaxID=278681 RepID=A0A8H8DMH8_9FUNG|nr:MAG: hypothetical protein BJ554DRAFT_315 [Olpidium bornovanus]